MSLGFCHGGESTIHFHSCLYKRVIVRGRSGLSTYGFLAGASRQPSLNHGSPLWQRARAAAFGPHFKSNQCLIHHGPLAFRAALHVQEELSGATLGCLWHGPPPCPPACVCMCVCIHSNRIRRGPHPPWGLSIWFYMSSDKVRRL